MTDEIFAAPLTDEEHTLVRRAAFGAIALVSQADPGFLATFKESMAGSRALQEAPEDVRELLTKGSFPTPRTGSPEEVRGAVLADLTAAMEVLGAKAPRQAEGFRTVVLAAADRVAAASEGVTAEEQAVVEDVRGALSAGTTGAPPGQDASGT